MFAELKVHKPGGLVDTVDSYFGIRSVGTQDGRVLLNGTPIYLKTVLDQGYWPQSNLTAPSDQAILDDIRKVKELGFNGVRRHQKVEDPRLLYWADRMGLLPISVRFTNEAKPDLSRARRRRAGR